MADLTIEQAEAMRDRLLKRLAARQPDIKLFHDYYDGRHRLPPLPENSNADIRALREWSVLNLCPLVVNAVEERLEVQGFEFGSGSSADVWRDLWQANQLDAVSKLVMQEALIARRSFCLVWPDGAGGVDIFPEVPQEVLVDYLPGTRGKRRAAIKQFIDDEDGTAKVSDVTLWTDTGVWCWRSKPIRTGIASKPEFELDLDRTGVNPLGVVPVVEFRSLPNLRGEPHSELDRGVLAVQDSINKTKFDRMVLQEFQAFPQRWATGIEPEVDSNGVPVAPFKIGPNRIAVGMGETDGKEVKFGQWDAADLEPLLKAVNADIWTMARITKTPASELAIEFSNVGAQAVQAAEGGLIKKTRGHQRTFGESWEEVIRLALISLGDVRANDHSSFIVWADPETRTIAEEADATVKLAPYLSQRETQRRLGYSPQEIDQIQAEMVSEQMTAAIAFPPPPPVA